MAIDQALSAPEIAALAGPSATKCYLVYDTTASTNIVATARVNGTPTYPATTITVDGTSAGWSDIIANDTVFIGSTAAGFDRGIYRVRKEGTATTLELHKIDDLDAGLRTIANRTSGIVDNDYVTVLKRFDIFGVFPVIDYHGVGLTADIYENSDTPYSNFNEFPFPVVNVTIDGKPSNFATHIYDATTYTFDIVIDFGLWPTTSVISWAVVLPSGIALNSGSLTGTATSETLNVTADHAADPYTMAITVVEDNGQRFVAYRKLWITSNTCPPLSVVGASWTDDTTGTRLTLDLNTLTSFPPGAMVHFFTMCTWNGTDVPSAGTSVTGYIAHQRESSNPGLANVSLDVLGPSYIMDLIGAQSQIMTVVAAPSTWQEIVADLSYVDFVAWWIVAQRASGLLQMFNWTGFGFDSTKKVMPEWIIDGGTLLSQLKGIAARVPGGNFGCDASGEFMLRQHYSMLRWNSVDERTGVPTRGALDGSQIADAELNTELRPSVRHIRAEAFIGTTDIDTVTPLWSDAPQVPGQGQREDKLEKLIVDSAQELYDAAGNAYAMRNNPVPNGTFTIKKFYPVFKPAQMLPIDLTIPASTRYDGAAWNNLILPTQVQYTHNDDGTWDTKPSFEQVTKGLAGKDAPIPVPDPTTYNSPYSAIPFSPVPSYLSPNPNPAGTSAGAVPKATTSWNGSGFCGTATKAYLATNIPGTVRYRDVTPPSLGAYTLKHGTIAVGTNRAYIIGSDGTNSKLWSCPDVTVASPVWTATGTPFAGVYTLVRTTGTAGTVMVYATNNGSSQTQDYDFTASDQGFTYAVGTFDTTPRAAYTGGTGWTRVYNVNGLGNSETRIYKVMALTITSISVTVTVGAATSLLIYDSDGTTNTLVTTISVPSSNTYTYSTPFALTRGLRLDIAVAGADVALTISDVQVTAAGATVRVSTDYGATVGSAVTVGASPGAIGGFDISRTGSVQVAAADMQVRTASTFGGAFSNASDGAQTAYNLLVPWYQRNANTIANTSQYIYGMPAAVAGKSRYWVASGTAVDITPTFSGNPGLSVGPNDTTTWRGSHIATVASFGGSIHLATNKNGGTIADWIDRGVQSGANIARVRRLASTPGQLIIAGNGILKYSADFGATLISKTLPSSSALLWFEFLG